jgi:hypothetical protein
MRRPAEPDHKSTWRSLLAEKTCQEIAAEYALYDTHPAFHKGAEDNMDDLYAA